MVGETSASVRSSVLERFRKFRKVLEEREGSSANVIGWKAGRKAPLKIKHIRTRTTSRAISLVGEMTRDVVAF